MDVNIISVHSRSHSSPVNRFTRPVPRMVFQRNKNLFYIKNKMTKAMLTHEKTIRDWIKLFSLSGLKVYGSNVITE